MITLKRLCPLVFSYFNPTQKPAKPAVAYPARTLTPFGLDETMTDEEFDAVYNAPSPRND